MQRGISNTVSRELITEKGGIDLFAVTVKLLFANKHETETE